MLLVIETGNCYCCKETHHLDSFNFSGRDYKRPEYRETMSGTSCLASVREPATFCASKGGHAYLTSDGQLVKMLIADWTVVFVLVIEHNGYASLCDACLSLFVYKLLQAVCPHLQVHF